MTQGSEIFGALNGPGTLTNLVTQPCREKVLAHVIEWVEQAQAAAGAVGHAAAAGIRRHAGRLHHVLPGSHAAMHRR